MRSTQRKAKKGAKKAARPSQTVRLQQDGYAAAALVGQVVIAPLSTRNKDAVYGALVVNTRYSYGHWDLHLVPLIGAGSVWLELRFVTPTGAYDKMINTTAMNDLERRANECGSNLERSSETGA